MVNSSLMNHIRTYPPITKSHIDFAWMVFFESCVPLLQVPYIKKATLDLCRGSPNQCVVHSTKPESQSKAWFPSKETIMAPNAILRTPILSDNRH